VVESFDKLHVKFFKSKQKIFSINSNSSTTQNTNTHTKPIADSGATDTYIRCTDTRHIKNMTTSHTPVEVGLPNGNTITSIGQGEIHFPCIQPIQAHIFQDAQLQRSLIALADFTNQGAEVLLTKTAITVFHNNQVILQGSKTADEKLWTLDLPEDTPTDQDRPITYIREDPSINHVITHQHNADMVHYWHRTMGCPTIATFVHAVSHDYVRTAPNLTATIIRKNPPNTWETSVGHLDMARQGIRSTKSKSTPTATTNNEITLDRDILYSATIPISEIQHSDLTGRLPRSKRGNEYILVTSFNGYTHGTTSITLCGRLPEVTRSDTQILQTTWHTHTNNM